MPRRLNLEALEDRAVPAGFTLDPGFGPARVGTAQSGPPRIADAGFVDIVERVLPLPGGGELVLTRPEVYSGYAPLSVTRLDAAGQVVASFGTGGRVVALPQAWYGDVPPALAVQADGKVLVGATSFDDGQSRVAFTVARLTADGRPDPTFGTDGVSRPTAAAFDRLAVPSFGRLTQVAAQPDGTTLVGGTLVATGGDGSGYAYAVARLAADGALDPAFGTGGVAVVAPAAVSPAGVLRDMVALSDGRVVLIGAGDGLKLTVARLTAGGQPDPTFGTGGVAAVDFGPRGRFDHYYGDAAVRPDGRVVLAAATGDSAMPQLTVAQLTAAGVPDAAFGQGGRFVSGSLGALVGGPNGVALGFDAAGRLSVVTWESIGRLAADGSGFDVPPAPLPLPAGDTLLGPEAGFDPAGGVYVGTLGPRTGDTAPVRVARLLPPEGLAQSQPPAPAFPTPPGRQPVPRPVPPHGRFVGSPSPAPSQTPAAPRAALPTPGGVLNVTGAAAGGPGVVTLLRADPVTGATLLSTSFAPFGADFLGGVSVTAADFDGDGYADLVATAGGGGGAVVAVYDGAKLAAGRAGDDAILVRFLGIPDAAFRGGSLAAVGDVTGDGVPDLIVAAGVGGGPRVTVWDGATLGRTIPRPLADFFAFESSGRVGVVVTAGDTNGDGVADLAFAAGAGGGPRVREFDGKALFATGADFATLDAAPPGAKRRDEFIGDPAGRDGTRVDYMPGNLASQAAPPAG